MSTFLAFNPVSDLTGSQSALHSATLSWSTPSRVIELVNMGAELGNAGGVVQGPPVGWTAVAGHLRVRTEASRQPPEGLSIFDGGDQATSRASQRFCPLSYGMTLSQLDGSPSKVMTVDWWGGTFEQGTNDQPKLRILFYNASLVLLGTHDSGFKNPTTAVGIMKWNQYQETASVPVGTRYIDFEMWVNRRNGTNSDGAIDDIRFSFEDEIPSPHVPGYAIYQDGVLVGTAAANAIEADVTGLSFGTYLFKIVAYDGTNFLSADSNEVSITIANDPAEDVLNDIFLFDDEEIFTGYLGGKLRGKTVACPGRNANTARKCGG